MSSRGQKRSTTKGKGGEGGNNENGTCSSVKQREEKW